MVGHGETRQLCSALKEGVSAGASQSRHIGALVPPRGGTWDERDPIPAPRGDGVSQRGTTALLPPSLQGFWGGFWGAGWLP